MVTIVNSDPVAKQIDIYDGLAKCYVEKTKQEFKYDFNTLQRDWVCVRIEGPKDFALRY